MRASVCVCVTQQQFRSTINLPFFHGSIDANVEPLFKKLYKECILMHRDCGWQVQYCSAGEEALSICTAAGRNPLWCHHCGWDHCHPHPGDAQYTLAHQTYIHNVTVDWTCKSCVCVCSGAEWVGEEDWRSIGACRQETLSPISAVQPLLAHPALRREPQGAVSFKNIYICVIMSPFIIIRARQ